MPLCTMGKDPWCHSSSDLKHSCVLWPFTSDLPPMLTPGWARLFTNGSVPFKLALGSWISQLFIRGSYHPGIYRISGAAIIVITFLKAGLWMYGALWERRVPWSDQTGLGNTGLKVLPQFLYHATLQTRNVQLCAANHQEESIMYKISQSYVNMFLFVWTVS